MTTPKRLVNGITEMAETAVTQFLHNMAIVQVTETLRTPAVTEMITKKVKAVLKDATTEKQHWNGHGSDLERMVDEEINQVVKSAVMDQLGLYMNVTPWKNGQGVSEVQVRERIRDLSARRVADHFKNLPGAVDTLVAKFIQEVEQGKIPPRVRQDLQGNLWDAFIRVVLGRFCGVLGVDPDQDDK
jgi:phage baseplate assembly protein W